VFRSLWERQVFKWCDDNPSIIKWSSEETVVPYRCKTDNKIHRYFVDLKIKTRDGKVWLIEIKPEKETKEPKKRKKTKRYINEVMTYIKNQSKWEAAKEYAENRGWKFDIWTEHTITGLGIKLVLPKKK
jgi:short-subunit dehydrogenase involved in D-alanine esterification of teichoic acids